MNSRARACIPHLIELGFTEIEAAAYTFLVQESPATAYRVAHGIGKPVANTYKAIDALRQRGAVIVDGKARRSCRAVPPDELLGMLDQRRRARVEAAARALSALEPAGEDDGVYAIGSRRQTLARFRDMLARARDLALIDVFPEPLTQLRPAIEAAAARGVLVAVQIYAPAKIRGVELIVRSDGAELQQRWPGQWLNIAIDGSEFLLAFFGTSTDQAIWSRSPYLSWIYHGGIASEMIASRLGSAIDEGASPPRSSAG